MDKQEMTLEKKIEQWKQKYGDVYTITVAGKVAYLHRPDRRTLSAAAVVGQKDPIKYNEILLANCWIEGDMEIQTNDSLFFGVSAQLSELVQVEEAELKKL